MKGLLLAGGYGTRLRPLTFTGNKHMIPIANQPMLFHGLRHLAAGGIREVAIVLGPLHEGIPEAIRDGSDFDLEVTYIHQGEPKGLAHAVACARDFLAEDPFVMYLGDNLLQEGIRPFVERFHQSPLDAVIGATPVQHPSSYGVVELDGDRIVSITEKPRNPKSNLALIGVYLFTPKIHPVIADLKPSARGELEITEAIWNLNQRGGRIAVRRVDGWWKDTGRPEDLLEANQRVLYGMAPTSFGVEGRVEEGARLMGPVSIGGGSSIGPDVQIDGPVVIGSEVKIDGASHIGPGTAVGSRSTIHQASVQRSILMESAQLEGPFQLVDSIVGRFARIRASQDRGLRLSCVLGDSTQLTF
jgi:glucose-1-phosphate thymidylyltransferase